MDMHSIIAKWLSLAFFATLTQSADYREKCNGVEPQPKVDWSKLVGSWYNMMAVPGQNSFVSCRRMRISEVDMAEKTLNVDFMNIAYSGNPKFSRSEIIYFQWAENEGIIHARVRGLHGSKTPYLIARKNADSNPSMVYTLTSTDHASYFTLLQCGHDSPILWVAVKETVISETLAETLNQKLSDLGFGFEIMNLNGTSCSL